MKGNLMANRAVWKTLKHWCLLHWDWSSEKERYSIFEPVWYFVIYACQEKRRGYYFSFLFAFNNAAWLLCSAQKQDQSAVVKMTLKKVRYRSEVETNRVRRCQWRYWPRDNCRLALMRLFFFSCGMWVTLWVKGVFLSDKLNAAQELIVAFLTAD